MVSIDKNRLMILESNGSWVQYQKQVGLMHQDCLDDYALKHSIPTKNAESVVKGTNSIIFYNLNDETLVGYMPNEITDEQLYQLDLFTLDMDNVSYMEVKKLDKDKTHFILDSNISDNFSNQVIQSYYTSKGKSK